MPRAPTITDVARLAGVGKATASRALNDRPDVSARTRACVLAAAQRLVFVPDAVSRRLAGRRWAGAIAHPRHRARLAYLRVAAIEAALAAHARTTAAGFGYDLAALAVPSARLTTMLAELHARGVEGLLIRSEEGRFPPLPAVWRQRFRCVLLGDHPEPTAPLVACDFARAVHLVCRLHPQRRIGFWLIDDGHSTAHLAPIGAVLAWQRRRPGISLHTDARSVAGWIGRTDPEVVVGPSVEHLQRLAAAGLLAGRSAVSLWGRRPGWCADVGFDLPAMQETALRLLVDLLNRRSGEGPATALLLPPAWRA